MDQGRDHLDTVVDGGIRHATPNYGGFVVLVAMIIPNQHIGLGSCHRSFPGGISREISLVDLVFTVEMMESFN